MFKEIFIAILVIYLTGKCFAKPKNYKVKATQMHAENANAKFVKDYKFDLKPRDETGQIYSASITLQPDVSITKLHDKLRTFYYNNTQSTVPVLLDEDLDICAILSGFHKSHLIDINNEAKNNVADGCPFKDRIYIEEYKMTFSSFPEMLPPGLWRLDHDFITKSDDDQTEEHLITVKTYFELESI